MYRALVAALVLAESPPVKLGTEGNVDDPVLTGATGEQTAPRAAWDGSQFLVTWRTSLWKNELRAVRLSAAGEPIDGRGVAVAELERADGSAAVAAGGGTFLLAWEEDPAKVKVARAPAQGPLAIAAPTTLWDAGDQGWVLGPSAAYTDPVFWVLWSRGGGASGVLAARVGADGKPLEATPVMVAAASAPTAITALGGRAYALWSAPAPAATGAIETRVARLEPDGRLLDAGGVLLFSTPGSEAGAVALAAGKDQLLATAVIGRAGGGSQVRAVRLGADARPLDATPLLLHDGPVPRSQPSLTWDGDSFLAMWSVEAMVPTAKGPRLEPRLAGAAIGPDGGVRPLPAPPWSTAGRLPALIPATAAGGAPAPLAVWEEVAWWTEMNDAADTDIRAVALAKGAAAAGEPRVVSRADNWQGEPVVAWNGRRALVAFEDRRADKPGADIYVARLDADGKVMDHMSLALATGPQVQRSPAAAWDGAQFVVVWHEGSAGLRVARVDEDGKLVGGTPLVVPGSEGQQLLSEPAICADGDGTLLVWASRKQAGDSREGELRGLRIPRGGQVTDGASFLLSATADRTAAVVRLACNDKAGLLVWNGQLQPADKPSLYLGRILRGQSAFAAAPGLVTLHPESLDEAAGIGTDGAGFLTSWRAILGPGMRTVLAARISAEGELVDRDPIRVGNSNSGRRVAAIWDGRQYVVLSVHTQNGNPFELRGRRISPAGEVFDREWFPVTYLSKPWGGGSLGSDGVNLAPGRTLLVYERYADDDGASNPRARAMILETPAGVPADGGAGEAGSGDGSRDAAPADGIPTGAQARARGGGCNCRMGAHARDRSWPALVVLALLLRRKRRQH